MSSSRNETVEGEDSGAADALETLLRAFRILRRRWLVVFATAGLFVAAMAVGVKMMRPYWSASATLVINPSGPQVLDKVQDINHEEDASAYAQYYETQRAIIRSRTVATDVIEGLGLAADPVFLDIEESQLGDERLQVDPYERMQEIVSVPEVPNSRVVEIRARYPDPQLARDIANAVADSYLAYVNRSRSDTGERAKVDLEAEREKAKEELRIAESSLDAFKSEHKITSIALEEQQRLINQNLITLSTRAKQAQAERYDFEAKYHQAKRLHREKSLAGASLLSASERVIFDQMLAERLEAERDFVQLDLRYGEKHPAWKKAKERLALIESRINHESRELLASFEARYKASLETERNLKRLVEVEGDRALKLASLEPRFRELEREAKNSAETYAILSRRDAEVGLTNRVQNVAPVEILDRATTPLEPVWPRNILLLVIALIGGIACGSVLAISADLRDHRIRSLADLERVIAGFGLPVLGQLPLLPADPQLGLANSRAQRRQRDLYTHVFPQSLMAERCRGLRTAVSFTLSKDSCAILLVTSPGSAEGKTSTALNLAVSFCQAGKKVCLIDADMRRPRLHQVFPPPLDRHEKGFAGLLQGEYPLHEALHGSGEDGAPRHLRVLTCGLVPENPAELLESSRCRLVMAELRKQFDVVIVDSPPVLPVTDPLILAQQVDGVILVARCEATSRTNIQRVLQSLRQGDTNLIGVVLNEVSSRSEGSKYTSEYYTYRAKEVGEAASGG